MNSLRLRYKTFEIGKLDIHIRMLRDIRQYHDPNGIAEKLGISSAAWPMFGVIWPSSEILAHLMLKCQTKGKRILEVGCGIALASMVLNQRLADITATDYHPETESFLDYNTSLNNSPKIPFIRAEWDNTDNSLGAFDIIIGSDLLYERDHADMLSKFINQHAKKDCDVIIVDPRRGNHASFTKKMENFNFSCRQENAHVSVELENANKNIILNYSRK